MTSPRFVPQTGTKEDDQDTRKSIRRYVMLGKNRGRTGKPKEPTLEGSSVLQLDSTGRTAQTVSSVIPRRVGSDLSLLEFADDVELPLMNETLHFCSATEEKMFALEPCISFDATGVAATCIQSFADDALHLNVMVFGIQMYKDQTFWQSTLSLRQGSHKTVLRHYGKALSLLRGRLESAERQPSNMTNITVASVIILAMHALVTGDSESAGHHVIGLSRLVNLRENGIYSFRSMTKHMIDILRCDISFSLATGQPPMFFADLSSRSGFPLPELVDLNNTPGRYPGTADSELVQIWDVVRRFCAMINQAAIDRKKLSDNILLETMASVMYRLLSMHFPAGSVDESTRLAMLSFCASIFLPLRQLRIPFDWLRLEHKRSIVRLIRSRLHFSDPKMTLWYLLLYGITFAPLPSDESDELQLWLMEVTSLCKTSSWDNVKEIIGQFLWIDIVCDRPARRLVEENLVRRAATINCVVA